MSDTDESLVLVDKPGNQSPSSASAEEPTLIAEHPITKDTPSISSDTVATTVANAAKSSSTEEGVRNNSTGGPEPYQIVSIGSAEDKYAFDYHKAKLDAILSKVPADTKVAVVSVVGAFRTGKSFLLSWFLRYLSHLQEQQQQNKSDTTSSSTTTTSGLKSQPWYTKFESVGKDGFDWKAGSERNTTGLWMWSEPFLIDNRRDGGQTAVLLIDTQGMFDHETTMALTASIFGFSTLLSSYQIYNVDKRIQEDNLQQLALFSEYARMAVGVDEHGNKKERDAKEQEMEVDDDGNVTQSEGDKPFQHIEFLVRDWQHFEDDGTEEDEEDFEAMTASMEKYLDSVIAERDAKDLQETRQQIVSCFEKITCYGLCHPGNAITKKKYTGEVSLLDETFLELLVRYCTRVFDTAGDLLPKVIHGHELTAEQLGVYIGAYAELFRSGAKFPTAGTMLEATAKANNTNAVHTAVASYKSNMNRVAGPACTNYVRPDELKEEHAKSRRQCLEMFVEMANFGSRQSIDMARTELLNSVSDDYEVYESLNEGRNPLAGFEIYVLPVAVAIVAFVTRWFTDATCSANMCRSASEVLSHVYVVVFIFLGIVASTKAKQIKDLFGRLQHAVAVMTNDKVKSE